MTQRERQEYLIRTLLHEVTEYRDIAVPETDAEQKHLLRALMNVRPAWPVSPEFLQVQDAWLQEESRIRGIVRPEELTPSGEHLYLWRGDITRLAADGIVNAANEGMTGCYIPNHACIDNCIHTYSGVQLRATCEAMMREQGYPGETGTVKITPAFNLPARYVLHTVGPIVEGPVMQRHRAQLASCYRACLNVAEENGLHSPAFCCISTGVFHFPSEKAAEIAVRTVKAHCLETGSTMDVIFNVFTERDETIYRKLLEEKIK